MAMTEQQIRTALEQHGSASAAGDLGPERNIYQENAVCEYPQSGERIHGKENLTGCGKKDFRSLRTNRPAKAVLVTFLPFNI